MKKLFGPEKKWNVEYIFDQNPKNQPSKYKRRKLMNFDA